MVRCRRRVWFCATCGYELDTPSVAWRLEMIREHGETSGHPTNGMWRGAEGIEATVLHPVP